MEEELRLNVLKLKYKLEREETLNAELKQRKNRLLKVSSTPASLERVVNRLHLLLQEKGMSLADLLRALPYDSTPTAESLTSLLRILRVATEREDLNMLLNYAGSLKEGTIDLQQLAVTARIRWE